MRSARKLLWATLFVAAALGVPRPADAVSDPRDALVAFVDARIAEIGTPDTKDEIRALAALNKAKTLLSKPFGVLCILLKDTGAAVKAVGARYPTDAAFDAAVDGAIASSTALVQTELDAAERLLPPVAPGPTPAKDAYAAARSLIDRAKSRLDAAGIPSATAAAQLKALLDACNFAGKGSAKALKTATTLCPPPTRPPTVQRGAAYVSAGALGDIVFDVGGTQVYSEGPAASPHAYGDLTTRAYSGFAVQIHGLSATGDYAASQALLPSDPVNTIWLSTPAGGIYVAQSGTIKVVTRRVGKLIKDNSYYTHYVQMGGTFSVHLVRLGAGTGPDEFDATGTFKFCDLVFRAPPP
jgi:hypothetical protein